MCSITDIETIVIPKHLMSGICPINTLYKYPLNKTFAETILIIFKSFMKSKRNLF